MHIPQFLYGKSSWNKPLIDDLNQIFNSKTKYDIIRLAGKFSQTGTSALIDFAIQPDEKHYNKYALYLRPANLKGHEDVHNMINGPLHRVPEYKDYIQKLMSLGFKNQDRLKEEYNIKNAGEIVIKMEKKLWEVKAMDNGNTQQLKMDIASHQWPDTVGAFLHGMIPSSIALTKLFLEDSTYFDKLQELIQTFELKDLKTYVAFQMIHSRTQWLGGDFPHVWNQKMLHDTAVIDRSTFCQNRIIELLPFLVGDHYTRTALDRKQIKKAEKMVQLVQDAMKDRLDHSTWMITNDIGKAKKKLSSMIVPVGETSYMSSIHYLEGDNHYVQVHYILSEMFRAQMRHVGREVNRFWSHKSPAIAQVKYQPNVNSVLFPSAMLQPPYFDGVSVHPARDFGAMGTIMGREITRGFDQTGSKYGDVGNKHEWWSDKTKGQFHDATKCMVNQYSSFTVHDKKVDPVATLDENIADVGGLGLAWIAYKKYMTEHSNAHLPGTSAVEATDGEKLFFLAYAQSLCTHIPRDSSTELKQYAPPEWRVNGAVMNNNNFDIVYGCKAGDPMYLNQKCNMW